jgi:hypothetical protein
VIDPLISKRQQLLLATQLCRMVLKVRFNPVLYCARLLRSTHVPSLPVRSLPSLRRPGKRGSRSQAHMLAVTRDKRSAFSWHLGTLLSTSCMPQLAYAVLRR